ncbi:MAG: exodeoxyribonuclease VII large subunit [Planctomycetota bacterium]|jgi:exodeoxyribonuclease VII large subunit
MTGTVELDPDGTHLLIRFPYREDLVAMVKDLSGRRWDPKQKVWRVPAKNVEEVFDQCSRHLFEFGPEIASLLAGTLAIPEIKKATKAAPAQGKLALPTIDALADQVPEAEGKTSAPNALSISQLNTRVRDCLRDTFADAFWITGEIVDYDKSAGREHRFFQLAEKAPRAQRPKAIVEVALFGRTADALLPKLAQGEPPLTLRDGLEIRALVKVDFYPASGRFQVIVQDIDPSFTLGKLALTREQILRELVQMGLAEQNRMLGLPVPALRIGVLTSPDADGWNDFRRHLEESRCGFDITIFPIKVQGTDLKPTLLKGLKWFAEREDQFDVLCVMRGGGSRTDLAWFDDKDIAVAVAQHPLKLMVGIGHQRDQSVLDAIAHSEKTPTAVAEFLVRGIESAREDVQERGVRLADAVADLLADEKNRLRELTRSITRATTERVNAANRRLANAGRDLASQTTLRLSHERSGLRQTAMRLTHSSLRMCERKNTALQQCETRRRLLDPVRVLQRGFAIVRGDDGRIAPSVTRITQKQSLRVQFRDGHANVSVDAIEPNPPADAQANLTPDS